MPPEVESERPLEGGQSAHVAGFARPFELLDGEVRVLHVERVVRVVVELEDAA